MVAVVEKLVDVAIIRGDQTHHNGSRSHSQLRAAINPPDVSPLCAGMEGDENGFWTSNGRFVDRDEAKTIALKSKQIGPMWEKTTRMLLSSDIDW